MPLRIKVAPPSNPCGLRNDAGWPDDAFHHIATSEHQPLWLSLLDHLRTLPEDKFNRSRAETLCFGLPNEPTPDPGSQQFHDILRSVAPPAPWTSTLESLFAKFPQPPADIVAAWIRAACRSSTGLLNRPGPNRDILNGLLWSSLCFPSDSLVDALRQLAFATEAKTSQPVTILFILGLLNSEAALAALHLISQQAKRPTPRSRAQKLALHLERRLNISADEAAERFIPTLGLSPEGNRLIPLGTHFAEIRIAHRHAELRFLDAQSREIKSLPAAPKREHAAALKELKADTKALDAQLTAQRARIESQLLAPRAIPLPLFAERYLHHPIVAPLAKPLIWNIDSHPAVFFQERWLDSADNPIAPTPAATISLWHPISSNSNEIRAWRTFLERHQITQPFKQAHREIYLLTDAERRTATYSNRFAAHIIRQHQFNKLAKARDWDFGLLGGWDAGSHGVATRRLPRHNLEAQFWVDLADHGYTDRGIALFVSTDQVRFHPLGAGHRRQTPNPLPLDQVPPLAFSEIMRDVDLFVGVCSVANDPTWNDGGPAGRYRQYWHDTSFGDLSATAQTRKEILAALLPRLAIASHCSLSDKFLLVRGSLRTYKIHLGSSNILMEPNDQYLCIVPDRSPKSATDNLYLPFEGDTTLSLILSKALLLANDSKIKDETILRQIRS